MEEQKTNIGNKEGVNVNLPIESVDINLYEYIHDHSKEMSHNELFYILLDWKDKHPEIRKALAKKYDTYTVKWYDESLHESQEMSFNDRECKNPYHDSLEIFCLCQNDPKISCAELWQNANPYCNDMIRTAKLLRSFERKE